MAEKIPRMLRDVLSVEEDLLIETMKDLVRDEIKRKVHKKLEKNPELREEIKKAVTDYLEAKAREGYAVLKLAKASAKLGVSLTPKELRQRLSKELVYLFEKEIGKVIKKTL